MDRNMYTLIVAVPLLKFETTSVYNPNLGISIDVRSQSLTNLASSPEQCVVGVVSEPVGS